MDMNDLLRIRDTLTVSLEKTKTELGELDDARRNVEQHMSQLQDAKNQVVREIHSLRRENMQERMKSRGWNESIASKVRQSAIDYLKDGEPKSLQEIHQHTSEGGVDVDATYLRKILVREVKKGDIIQQMDNLFFIRQGPDQEEQ